MKKRILFISSLIIFFFSSNLYAQFSINAELRTRGEANHGLLTLPTESSETAFFVTQRTRLNLKYKSDNLTSYFSLQDARLWGQEDIATKTGIQSNTFGLEISQAWLNWSFHENWGLKTGRQIWSYDDGRILSNRNWNQTALSWDALLLHLDKDDFHFHVGSSINNTYAHFNRPQEYGDDPYETPYGYRIRYFNFIWLKFHINENLTLSIADYLASYLKEGTTSTYYTKSTAGLHFDYHSENWKILGNGFYQFGKSGVGKNISAYMFTIAANYKTPKLSLGAGMDYISGNDDKKDYQAFDLMYGARFKYNGWMNYYLIPGSTANGGLIDIYPNINWKLNKKHSVYATYHFFYLAQQAYELPLGGGDYSYLNSNLGGELNMSYTYKYNKAFKIQAFAGYYFATETTEFIKGVSKGESTTPIWASIMLTYKPELFNSEK